MDGGTDCSERRSRVPIEFPVSHRYNEKKMKEARNHVCCLYIR